MNRRTFFARLAGLFAGGLAAQVSTSEAKRPSLEGVAKQREAMGRGSRDPSHAFVECKSVCWDSLTTVSGNDTTVTTWTWSPGTGWPEDPPAAALVENR